MISFVPPRDALWWLCGISFIELIKYNLKYLNIFELIKCKLNYLNIYLNYLFIHLSTRSSRERRSSDAA